MKTTHPQVMQTHSHPPLNTQQLSLVEQVAISELFSGYDRIEGEDRTAALLPNDQTPYSLAAQGGEASIQVEVWAGAERVKKAMSVKGKFGASIAGIFNFEASGRADLKSDISSYGVTVAVICERCQLIGRAKDYILKNSDALQKQLETPKGLKEFTATYGDSYVSSVHVGGRFLATFSMVATSEQHQSKLDAAVGASGFIKALFLEGGAQGAVNDFESKNNVNISLHCSFSGVKDMGPESLLDPQHIITFARDYLKAPLNNPAIIGGELSGYENVRGLLKFEPVAHNRNAFLDSVWSSQALKVRNCYRQSRWITAIYDFFNTDMRTRDKDLHDKIKLVKKDLITLGKSVKAYRTTPGQPIAELENPPELASIKNGIPSPDYIPQQDSEFGGQEGGYFDDLNLAKPQRIAEITIWADDEYYVHRMDLKYEYLEYNTLSPSENLLTHGEDQGYTPAGPVIINSDDYIQTIDLRSGRYLDRIKFITKKGSTIEAGGTGGSPHTRQAEDHPDYKRLVAFQGRSGRWIDMLRPCWYIIKKASWHNPVDMDI